MILGRFLSLVLCMALVACPTVCRAGQCAERQLEPTKTAGCSHCPTGQDRTSNDPNQSRPGIPCDSCDMGNCLCAGAVTNHAGLDLQIGHVLGMFAVVQILIEPPYAELSLSAETHVASTDHGPPLSGRTMRLRIESLLI